jgi:hypothetical protein
MSRPKGGNVRAPPKNNPAVLMSALGRKQTLAKLILGSSRAHQCYDLWKTAGHNGFPHAAFRI